MQEETYGFMSFLRESTILHKKSSDQFTKSSKAGISWLIVDFLFSFLALLTSFLIFNFGRKTDYYTIPALTFEIFQNFSHFPRCYVLSSSTSCEATHTFCFW